MARKKRKTVKNEYYVPSISLDEILEFYSQTELGTFERHVAWAELQELISCRTADESWEVIQNFIVLKWSVKLFRKVKIHYAPLFDQRIFTEKLLGKPSPGLPPPVLLSFA